MIGFVICMLCIIAGISAYDESLCTITATSYGASGTDGQYYANITHDRRVPTGLQTDLSSVINLYTTDGNYAAFLMDRDHHVGKRDACRDDYGAAYEFKRRDEWMANVSSGILCILFLGGMLISILYALGKCLKARSRAIECAAEHDRSRIGNKSLDKVE